MGPRCLAVIDASWAHDTTSHPRVRDRCKQGSHRHMSNNINTGVMNFSFESAAAFPSQTVAAFPLTSTVQSSLDPLLVNDPWASAVALRLVQQQHQTEVPFWSQFQVTEFWPQTGQPQLTTGNRHSRRHQHGMQMLLDLVVETAVDRTPRGLVGMLAERRQG